MDTRARLYEASSAWQREHLLGNAKKAGIDPASLQPVVEHLVPPYADADARAVGHQRRFIRASIAVYALSAVAVTVAIYQLLFAPHHHELIWIEVFAMLLALALLRLSKKFAWKQRWLLARFVAERLRTAMFRAVVPGFVEEPFCDPTHALPFYTGPDAELVGNVNDALVEPGLADCHVQDPDVVRRFLVGAWIQDQVAFHRSAAEKRRRTAHRIHRVVAALFFVTFLAAVLHALGVGHTHDPEPEPRKRATWVAYLATFFTIALPAWASAFHGMGDLLDGERIAARSDRMAELLTSLATRAEEAGTMDELRLVAGEAEQVMAVENFEWLVSLGFRSPPPWPA